MSYVVDHFLRGNDSEITVPSNADILNVEYLNKSASIYFGYKPDGRVSDVTYEVSVQYGRIGDEPLEVDRDTHDHLFVVEKGFYHGDMTVAIITLTETQE